MNVAAPAAEERPVWAARALRAHRAMHAAFGSRGGGYRGEGRLPLKGAAHLWSFIRAFVATLDLAGLEPDLRAAFDADREIHAGLAALERYWDERRQPPAYASDVVGSRFGGDRYIDDNAWVGLALVELERLRPGWADLGRAEAILGFARQAWDGTWPEPEGAGGFFWVEQGRGLGRRNHDRNTVSTAPVAELALHLAELGRDPRKALRGLDPLTMQAWVEANLDSSGTGGGPFWDKVRGDGSVDRATWSYNQGSMAGLAVLLHRRARDGDQLARAEAIARSALAQLPAAVLDLEPPAFAAILFRNLLLVSAATPDPALRAQIRTAMEGYARRAWSGARDERDRLHLSHGGFTLLGQSALVQIMALLAWDPQDYRHVA